MNISDLIARNRLEPVSRWMLYIAALTFPFSVAATNISLGIALFCGLISGQLREGMKMLWLEFRPLSLALLGYMSLMLGGLLWSLDLSWGLHIMGRQWFWFLLPLVAVIFRDRARSNCFLMALSTGLTLNLIFCVFQIFGWVTVTVIGSNAMDPTGHIGHIGFGFVYGIWAAWLFHQGWTRQNFIRWGTWLLALWSVTMVFIAQGRSGYLVVLALLLSLNWKLFYRDSKLKHAFIALGLLGLMGSVVILGPAKGRLMGTLTAPDISKPVDIHPDSSPKTFSMASTQMHLLLWQGALAAWKTHPFLGAGTGGFPTAAMQVMKASPLLNYSSKNKPAHPHNTYLLALARWGPLGPIVLMWLLYTWIKLSWKTDWQAEDGGILIALPGIALAVHGLTASSLEEHFSIVLAVMLLGIGITRQSMRKSRDP